MPPLLAPGLELALLELALLELVCFELACFELACFELADAFASAFLRLLARISSTLACALSDIPEPNIPEPLSDLSSFLLDLLAFDDSVLAEDLSAGDLTAFLRSRPGSNGSAGRSPFFSSLAPRLDWEAILSLSVKSLCQANRQIAQAL